jgi:hypothetical protein
MSSPNDQKNNEKRIITKFIGRTMISNTVINEEKTITKFLGGMKTDKDMFNYNAWASSPKDIKSDIVIPVEYNDNSTIIPIVMDEIFGFIIEEKDLPENKLLDLNFIVEIYKQNIKYKKSDLRIIISYDFYGVKHEQFYIPYYHPSYISYLSLQCDNKKIFKGIYGCTHPYKERQKLIKEFSYEKWYNTLKF